MRLWILFSILIGLCLTRPTVIEWSRVYSPIHNLSHEESNALKMLWEAFLKNYGHVPSFLSFRNFESNVVKMWKHLMEPSTFTMGINKFAAMVVIFSL